MKKTKRSEQKYFVEKLNCDIRVLDDSDNIIIEFQNITFIESIRIMEASFRNGYNVALRERDSNAT